VQSSFGNKFFVMKTIFLLPVMALALTSGCSKQAVKEETQVLARAPAHVQLNSLRTSNDFQSRIQVYNLMTADEQFRLWYDHLTLARGQFENNAQSEKVALVEQLFSNLKVELFKGDRDNAELDVFLNYFVPLWNDQASRVFTALELYDLVSDPTAEEIGVKVAPMEIGTSPGGSVPDCFCHVGTSGFSCRRISVGIPSGIVITNGICELVGNCSYSRRGCGFLWLSSCNGNHCNF
jgi:hypothetical protein